MFSAIFIALLIYFFWICGIWRLLNYQWLHVSTEWVLFVIESYFLRTIIWSFPLLLCDYSQYHFNGSPFGHSKNFLILTACFIISFPIKNWKKDLYFLDTFQLLPIHCVCTYISFNFLLPDSIFKKRPFLLFRVSLKYSRRNLETFLASEVNNFLKIQVCTKKSQLWMLMNQQPKNPHKIVVKLKFKAHLKLQTTKITFRNRKIRTKKSIPSSLYIKRNNREPQNYTTHSHNQARPT